MDPIDVYFVLLPGVLLTDFAGPAEALRIANGFGGRFALQHVGPEPRPRTSLGLALDGVAPLPAQLPAGAWLVIPGLSSTVEGLGQAAIRATIDWLRQVWRPDVKLLTICSAALVAASAGLLDDRRCTTHHTLTERLRALAPRARVEDDRVFVIDGGVATSAGVTTGIDLALELIAAEAGPRTALEVARDMVVWLRRDGDAPQLSPFLAHRNHLHPAIHRVQDAISADPSRGWPLAEMARIACVSPRHLARLFREHAGIAPLDYRQQLQLAHVEPLLADAGRSLERIAEAGGFGSARDLRRVWQRQRGTALRRG
ncbi:GlxA family transcriptional regulator [Chitinimonas koreensis]|uniref:GlxA family transcriptional regulator n=1 Tax=Chitinimonas koreensis TaxID=356302 RepID=UPI0004177137|nr:helix-turn-helix domain-containing protein [Chitinimonas koreensis]QNM97993.1 helix-turn-helix domain-containing protein [Chitinimonas koreensis]